MSTSLLKRLDAGLHGAASLFARALPRPAVAGPEKTLIVRPGGLGDLVCADIALQELGLDGRDFDWLIETRSQPWAEYRGLPHWCYDARTAQVLGGIRGAYARVINTEQLFGLAQSTALLARARGGRLFCFETNRGARQADIAVPYDWKDRHETIEFARLFAAALGRPAPKLERTARERVLPPTQKPIVVIAGQQSASRRLGIDGWVAAISQWHKGRAFFIAATPQDAAFADQLVQRFDRLAGRFGGAFPELCGEISRSVEMLTMDGGAVHIASWFGVPTLALFTSGRDRKWSPLGAGSRVWRRLDLPCQPCTKFGQVPPCPFNYACLDLRETKPGPPL